MRCLLFKILLYHTIIWICPSVRLLPIYSVVFGQIATELGRKVGEGTPQELRALVSMETQPLSWYSKKKLSCDFDIGSILTIFGRYNIEGNPDLPAENEQNPPCGFRDMAITNFSQSQDSIGSLD